MKYRKYLLVAAALVVIGATSIKPAMAYFTNSHQAAGTFKVYLGDLEITPNEDAKEWTKEITVQNTGDYDVFVRVKAICGSQYSANLASGDGWSYNEDDGYYYYSDLLAKDATSSVLKLTITPPKGLENETFNVVIVQEAAKVVDEKDADGNKTGKLVAAWDEAIMKQDKFEAKFQDTTKSKESTSEGGNN